MQPTGPERVKRRNRRPKTLAQRFCEKVEIQQNGCWLWTGARTARDKRAYGCIGVEYKQQPAHRVSYEMFVGPIPEGLDLDHLCRTRLCVNPDHLEPVTRRENLRRGTGMVAENIAKTHCKHGHQFSPENTKVYVYPHRTERVCLTCSRARALASIRRRKAAA